MFKNIPDILIFLKKDWLWYQISILGLDSYPIELIQKYVPLEFQCYPHSFYIIIKTWDHFCRNYIPIKAINGHWPGSFYVSPPLKIGEKNIASLKKIRWKYCLSVCMCLSVPGHNSYPFTTKLGILVGQVKKKHVKFEDGSFGSYRGRMNFPEISLTSLKSTFQLDCHHTWYTYIVIVMIVIRSCELVLRYKYHRTCQSYSFSLDPQFSLQGQMPKIVLTVPAILSLSLQKDVCPVLKLRSRSWHSQLLF